MTVSWHVEFRIYFLCLAKDDFDSEGNLTQFKISSFKSLSFISGFQCCLVNSLEVGSVVIVSIHLIRTKNTQFLETVLMGK